MALRVGGLDGARTALGFLTIVGTAAGRPDRRAVAWFAPVGALVGLAVGNVWWAAADLWPPLLAALLAVVVDALLTGMLHLDGLADSADGLLPPLPRARRLAVMADPAAGAFAVVVVALVLAIRVGALAALTPNPLPLLGLWAAARAAMAVTIATVPYARAAEGGLASAFAGAPVAPALVGGGIGLGVVVLTVGGPAGLAAALALPLGAGGVVALAVRRLGGFTGDVLGAAGVMGETFGLLLAASGA